MNRYKVIFIVCDINEARIIKGFSQERGIDAKVYASPHDAIEEEKADIVVVDHKIIKEESLKLIFSLSSNFLFILPFWMNAAKEVHKLRNIAEKLGFREKKIKIAKRPFTAEELINYIEKIFILSS